MRILNVLFAIVGMLILCVLLLPACTKTSPTSTGTTPTGTGTTTGTTLAIQTISPSFGPGGSGISVTGTGFSSTAANDSFFVNGHYATIATVTATTASIQVPTGAGSGPVSVKVGNSSAAGPAFTYQYTYMVSTFAGGTRGAADGTGTAAQFNYPYGIAVDTAGNLIVADDGNSKIRLVTPAGVVSTIAGNGTPGFANGPAASAEFSAPPSATVDNANNILVADPYNYKIREVSTAGVVSTFAGTTVGEADGPVATAEFDGPTWLAVDKAANVFVSDAHYIRKITGGVVSTLYDGLTYSSTLGGFTDLAVTPGDTLLLLDDLGANVFQLTPGGIFTSIAGTGSAGYFDGAAATAQFNNARGIALDATGNILLAEEANQRIRLISPAGQVSTIAGSGTAGGADGPGATAQFNYPVAIAVDKKSGTIYVLEPMNNRIRKITVQ